VSMGKMHRHIGKHLFMHKLHLNRLVALVYVEKCSGKNESRCDLLLNLPFMFNLLCHYDAILYSILFCIVIVLCMYEFMQHAY
jgi:hypothetical protein